MKYIVTGGAGFIGGHLARTLLDRCDQVVIIDDLSTGKQENVDAMEHKNLTFYKMSIGDNLDEVFSKEKPDGVFHFAALPRVQFSIAEPVKTHEANVNGTLNLLEACKKHDKTRIVFSSSSSVYGDQDTLPLVETMKPNPLSPYALHKLVGEYYCHLYTMHYDLPTVSLRYFNVYGPRQDPEGAYATLIPKFMQMFLNGETPVINGDGKQTRDFTYVTDVVNANIAAMETSNKDAFGDMFNVGAGNNVSVNDVADRLRELAKSDVDAQHGPAVIEPKDTYADIAKTKSVLGWEPKVTFDKGIELTFEDFSK